MSDFNNNSEPYNTKETDELMYAFASKYRRESVRFLIDENKSSFKLSEVAEFLSGQFDENSRDITIKLHQHHLPKLEDTGLITYKHATNEKKIDYHKDTNIERTEEEIKNILDAASN